MDAQSSDEWRDGFARGRELTALRIEAMIKSLSPEHITPVGVRQLHAVLQAERWTDDQP